MLQKYRSIHCLLFYFHEMRYQKGPITTYTPYLAVYFNPPANARPAYELLQCNPSIHIVLFLNIGVIAFRIAYLKDTDAAIPKGTKSTVTIGDVMGTIGKTCSGDVTIDPYAHCVLYRNVNQQVYQGSRTGRGQIS